MEVERSILWALLNGIVVSNNGQDGSTVHAPFSLSPYAYPRGAFSQAQALAPLFNRLVHKVAAEKEWLLKALENV